MKRMIAALAALATAISPSAGTEDGDVNTVKTRHCLIIPVEFEDVKMTVPHERLERLVSGESGIKAYFDDQFLGRYEFHFHLTGTLTLSHKRAYYGRNYNGKDRNPYLAVTEACGKAHEDGIDFSTLDGDNDGYVDNVFLIAAGEDEADGGGEDCIWSHAWYLSKTDSQIQLDGKTVDSYAITSELKRKSNGKVSFTGIGPFCHEYSHTLGLKDMYDTDADASGGTSHGLWQTSSLMDRGHLNNDGRTPAGYNAIDRDMLGIGQPEKLKPGKYVLEPVSRNGRYLKCESEKEGEYYLLECRSNTGWDRYIEGHGLAIYHVDRSDNAAGFSSMSEKELTASERWETNEVNSNPGHECAMMVPASHEAAAASDVFWPYGKSNTFSAKTVPAFIFWDGTPAGLEITDIMQAGENVEFTVRRSGESAIPKAKITRKDVYQDIAIIQWESSTKDAGTANVSLTFGNQPTGTFKVNAYAPGKYALRLEGLKPASTYNMKITYSNGTTTGRETAASFSTRNIYKDGYPFIFLNVTGHNGDGTFNEDAALPLCVFNKNSSQPVEWFLDGRGITPEADGYFHVTRSCILTARITELDGSIDYIEKRITVKK